VGEPTPDVHFRLGRTLSGTETSGCPQAAKTGFESFVASDIFRPLLKLGEWLEAGWKGLHVGRRKFPHLALLARIHGRWRRVSMLIRTLGCVAHQQFEQLQPYTSQLPKLERYILSHASQTDTHPPDISEVLIQTNIIFKSTRCLSNHSLARLL